MEDARPISVRVHRAASSDEPRPALLWVHGGGYVIGSAAQDDAICRHLAQSLGIVVAAAEYRLAPQHRFPVPLHDCYDALALAHLPTRRRPGSRRSWWRERRRRARRRVGGAGSRPGRGTARIPVAVLPDARRPDSDPDRPRRATVQDVEQQGEPFRLAVLHRASTGLGQGQRVGRTGALPTTCPVFHPHGSGSERWICSTRRTSPTPHDSGRRASRANWRRCRAPSTGSTAFSPRRESQGRSVPHRWPRSARRWAGTEVVHPATGSAGRHHRAYVVADTRSPP